MSFRKSALLFIFLASSSVTNAGAQNDSRSLPLIKVEAGVGLSPFGVGNGLGARAAIAVFPARLGVIARVTSHTTAAGEHSGLLKLGPPKGRVVDRAIMLGGHLETEVDALFTVALGVGQLWGERLNSNKSGFVTMEQRLGIATEIGAYMPTRNSGLGTVILANVTTSGFVVGFVVTFFIGF
jgi:hypothetical protein